MSTSPTRLTTPDLVVLNLLLEKEQHGYELSAELERREVKDWAGVSRPQVYYSLKKLADQDMIQPASQAPTHLGPERQVFGVTVRGRQAFEEALGRPEWAEQRIPPPFITWLALSQHATRETMEEVTSRRAAYLQGKIATENQHLQIVQAEPERTAKIAGLMISHTIRECESELSWLAEVRSVLLGP